MFTSHSLSIFFNTFTRSLSFLLAYNTYISFPRFPFLFFFLFSCEYCLYLGKRKPLCSYTPPFFVSKAFIFDFPYMRARRLKPLLLCFYPSNFLNISSCGTALYPSLFFLLPFFSSYTPWIFFLLQLLAKFVFENFNTQILLSLFLIFCLQHSSGLLSPPVSFEFGLDPHLHLPRD